MQTHMCKGAPTFFDILINCGILNRTASGGWRKPPAACTAASSLLVRHTATHTRLAWHWSYVAAAPSAGHTQTNRHKDTPTVLHMHMNRDIVDCAGSEDGCYLHCCLVNPSSHSRVLPCTGHVPSQHTVSHWTGKIAARLCPSCLCKASCAHRFQTASTLSYSVTSFPPCCVPAVSQPRPGGECQPTSLLYLLTLFYPIQIPAGASCESYSQNQYCASSHRSRSRAAGGCSTHELQALNRIKPEQRTAARFSVPAFNGSGASEGYACCPCLAHCLGLHKQRYQILGK